MGAGRLLLSAARLAKCWRDDGVPLDVAPVAPGNREAEVVGGGCWNGATVGGWDGP